MHGAAYKHVPSVVRYLAEKGARMDVWNAPNKQRLDAAADRRRRAPRHEHRQLAGHRRGDPAGDVVVCSALRIAVIFQPSGCRTIVNVVHISPIADFVVAVCHGNVRGRKADGPERDPPAGGVALRRFERSLDDAVAAAPPLAGAVHLIRIGGEQRADGRRIAFLAGVDVGGYDGSHRCLFGRGCRRLCGSRPPSMRPEARQRTPARARLWALGSRLWVLIGSRSARRWSPCRPGS